MLSSRWPSCLSELSTFLQLFPFSVRLCYKENLLSDFAAGKKLIALVWDLAREKFCWVNVTKHLDTPKLLLWSIILGKRVKHRIKLPIHFSSIINGICYTASHVFVKVLTTRKKKKKILLPNMVGKLLQTGLKRAGLGESQVSPKMKRIDPGWLGHGSRLTFSF